VCVCVCVCEHVVEVLFEVAEVLDVDAGEGGFGGAGGEVDDAGAEGLCFGLGVCVYVCMCVSEGERGVCVCVDEWGKEGGEEGGDGCDSCVCLVNVCVCVYMCVCVYTPTILILVKAWEQSSIRYFTLRE
jgi:hypothetical protein